MGPEEFNAALKADQWPPSDEATLRAMGVYVEATGGDLPAFHGMLCGDQRYEELGSAVELAWEMNAGYFPVVDGECQITPRELAMARTIAPALTMMEAESAEEEHAQSQPSKGDAEEPPSKRRALLPSECDAEEPPSESPSVTELRMGKM